MSAVVKKIRRLVVYDIRKKMFELKATKFTNICLHLFPKLWPIARGPLIVETKFKIDPKFLVHKLIF